MALAEDKNDILNKIKITKSLDDLEKIRLYYLGKKGLIPEGKIHVMSKRSNKFIRNTKRSAIISPGDSALIDHMLPYNK